MTKQELISSISKETGVSKASTELVVLEAINQIQSALKKGDSIFLRGFGTFIPKHRKAKRVRLISANKPITIPARRVPFFRPSKDFRNSLNK